MIEIPERAVKRALAVDKIDGDSVAVLWRDKPSGLFFLRGGLVLASSATFATLVLTVPYLRARVSGAGFTRVIHFDEHEAEVAFADEATATEFELQLLERTALAEQRRQDELEAEQLAADQAEATGSSGGRPEDGLVRRLERLAALHASGDLSDEEYTVAKAAVLRGL